MSESVSVGDFDKVGSTERVRENEVSPEADTEWVALARVAVFVLVRASVWVRESDKDAVFEAKRVVFEIVGEFD